MLAGTTPTLVVYGFMVDSLIQAQVFGGTVYVSCLRLFIIGYMNTTSDMWYYHIPTNAFRYAGGGYDRYPEYPLEAGNDGYPGERGGMGSLISSGSRGSLGFVWLFGGITWIANRTTALDFAYGSTAGTKQITTPDTTTVIPSLVHFA